MIPLLWPGELAAVRRGENKPLGGRCGPSPGASGLSERVASVLLSNAPGAGLNNKETGQNRANAVQKKHHRDELDAAGSERQRRAGAFARV